jgi:Fic family protein
MSAALVNGLSAADRALGEFAGFYRFLPNLHLLSSILARREAVSSSRIEGNADDSATARPVRGGTPERPGL